MALAGSNGGSWSTSFSPKSTTKLAGESPLPGGEVEAGNANNLALPCDYRGRLCIPGSSTQGVGFGDRLSTPAGNPLNLSFQIRLVLNSRRVKHKGINARFDCQIYMNLKNPMGLDTITIEL